MKMFSPPGNSHKGSKKRIVLSDDSAATVANPFLQTQRAGPREGKRNTGWDGRQLLWQHPLLLRGDTPRPATPKDAQLESADPNQG